MEDHGPSVRRAEWKDNAFQGLCVTGSRADSIGAGAINRLGLIATMMNYGYSPPLRAMEETLVVTIDQARVVNVPTGTEALIVGNAAIADLTLLKQGATMIITGKGFAETNFIALDAAGNPLAQSLIRVGGGRNALLVQHGLGRILRLRAAKSANREARGRCQIFRRGRRPRKEPQRACDQLAIGLP
jgi:Pilus formation protein N terminal region